MNKRKYWPSIFIFILIALTSTTTLCYTDETSEDNKYEPLKDQNLDILYVGTNYLLPYPPASSETNKTTLPALNSTTFSHNLRDRRFNNKIKPELNLRLDADGTSGIDLEFEINFQAVEDLTQLPGKQYKIKFNNYTTKGTPGGEAVNITYIRYDGEPFDIKSGSDNWCMVFLTIKRTDNISASSLTVYCGAKNRISYIRIPYSQSLSAYEYEQTQQDDSGSTPGFTSMAIIMILVLLAIINYFSNQRSRSFIKSSNRKEKNNKKN